MQEATSNEDSQYQPYVQALLGQLEESKEREQWYRRQLEAHTRQIGELTSTIKLLEHQRPAPFWQKWFK